MQQEAERIGGEDWFRYALALEASQEGYWDWDLVADRLWGSRQWQSITGVSEPCSGLNSWTDRVHPLDKPRLEAELRAVRAGKTQRLRSEHRIRHGSGEWRWVLASGIVAQDEKGRITHLAGSLVDRTECRMADALTGLPNRAFFLDHLERRIERGAACGNWNFAILTVSLHRFNRAKDVLGISGGDRLLMETAQRIQSLLSDDSITARLTGAEFLVCLESVHSEAEARKYAEEIANIYRAPFLWQGQRIFPQLAIGLAMANTSSVHPEDLMSDAETALAQARGTDPPEVVCYTRGMRERAHEIMQMEADLDRAIRNGELVMFYQPEVNLQTGHIVGFEALVRWQHARKGLLPPSEFIPLAEETGLILPLGDWGMAEACRQLVLWRRAGHAGIESARMSVNLSARQFERPDLVERVRQILTESELGPGALRLEVTESSVISDAASALRTMRALGKLGVGLHMDDFGTGYSSLHYLRQFPFDTLKIDRSFVQGVVADRESHQIVQSILDLARTFGMDVVAEGIEDEAQLKELRKMGCPCGQGYYFARPMAAAAIDTVLHAGTMALA